MTHVMIIQAEMANIDDIVNIELEVIGKSTQYSSIMMSTENYHKQFKDGVKLPRLRRDTE